MNITVTTPLTTVTPQKQSSARDETSNTTTDSSTAQELKQIQQLKTRDREVRAHEAAHVAAGAGLIRAGTSFTFQRGPDGVQYAIGGEVSIDTSKVVNNPEATLRKAEQIRSAALAPAQPSSQDRNVAAKAAQLAIEARAELNQQQNNEDKSKSFNTAQSNSTSSSGNLFDSIA
ncbi:MAG: putative metalloprotease CJM1_0395 family protein [Gammaproteobacteria bacterium]|nr:putative metalloprotease CJM1_0395 family protein [Gammaproteobacteria bacterium]